MRSGIHLLQNAHMIYRDEPVTKGALQKICMVVSPMEIKSLWDTIKSTARANSIARLSGAVEKLVLDGYPLSIILSLLSDYIIRNGGGLLLHERED